LDLWHNITLAAQLGAREGQQLVDVLERVLGGEPVGQSDEGDLVGEPQAVIAPATRLALFQVLRGQDRLGDGTARARTVRGRGIGQGRCPGKRRFCSEGITAFP
jgi:hypothetical protein